MAPGPEEVPIKHSSSYILQERSGGAASRSGARSGGETLATRDALSTEAVDSGNALQWALHRADAYFDKVESDSATNSTARTLVSHPATQGAMRTMQGVTSFGAAAAPHVMKAALPVGKKLLSASADVLLAGVGALNDAGKRNRQRAKGRRADDAEPSR